MAIAEPRYAEIRADSVYSLPDFIARTGLGAKAVRRVRGQGLQIHRVGRRCYVRGESWISYLANQSGAAK